MKRLLALTLLLVLASCGMKIDAEAEKDSGDRGGKKPEVPKVSKVLGEWKTECSLRTITSINLKDDSTYERVDVYFENIDCTGSEQEFISGGEYKLAEHIEENVYGFDITPDGDTETLYYSLKIDKDFIQLSAGHSSSPEMRVISFQDKDKMYKVEN